MSSPPMYDGFYTSSLRMSSRRTAPGLEDLRNIVRENWKPPHNPFDEVYPGIFIGDAKTATNVNTLESMSVTHILNAAFGTDSFRYVNTNEKYYAIRKFPCEFYGIPAMDLTAFQLHYYFEESTQFIHKALESSNGKVLVHCREGISRSATLVIAYLMMKKDMSAMEAVKLVRSKRQIYPNDGFLEQLCDLDLRLRSEKNCRGS